MKTSHSSFSGTSAQKGFILTDGGLETTLIYHQHIDLPHFAAFELLLRQEGEQALKEYYLPYLSLAERYQLPFILETPTWRANTDWAARLGYPQHELDQINAESVKLMRALQGTAAQSADSILVSGNIGPRGDGYVVGSAMQADEALAYHQSQIRVFADEAVDRITAMTMTYRDEAVGIALASRDAGLPVVISYTVETDGRLPSGESLRDAIENTDRLTDGYVAYYMINCAHPDHFIEVLTEPGSWKDRIHGIRANASAKSHAELDAATELDPGDKQILSGGYHRLTSLLPGLQVIGGCCGTDHSHIENICARLFA